MLAVEEAQGLDDTHPMHSRRGRRLRRLLEDNGNDDDFARRRDRSAVEQSSLNQLLHQEVVDDDSDYLELQPREINPREYVRNMSLASQYIILLGQFKLLLTIIELVSLNPGADGSFLSIVTIMLQLAVIFF